MGWKYRRQFTKAQKLFEANDLLGSDQIFSEIIAGWPNQPDPYLHRAFVRMRQGRFDDALQDISRGVELRPENGVMHMLKGEILFERGSWLESYDALRKACELEKDNGRAFFFLGRACIALGRRQEAADYFEVALQFERDFCLSQWMSLQLSA